MKFRINQDKNKIAKNTLAIVLAGSVAFSPTFTLAAQESTEEENIEKIDLQTLSLTDENTTEESDTKTEEAPATNVEGEETQLEDIQEVAPTLVPGDLFYFTKIAFEKIKLALTFNNVKEAELLATFAAERLAEAEVLFSEGKENEALETIEKALEHFENTEAIIEDEKESDETSTNEEIENNTSTDDSAPVEDENKTEDESLVEVEKVVAQNILSLQAAMAKVKNPVAKAALEKNIKQSYAKLAKKQAKFAEKAQKKTSDEEKTEDKEVVVNQEVIDNQEVIEVEKEASTTLKEVGAETKTTEMEVTTTPNEEMVKAPVEEAVSSTIQTNKKEVQAEAKQQKEVVKEETKQKKEAIKQEMKQTRIEVKEESKQQKKEAKQNTKQQHDSSKGNAQEKVKEENEK
jgi:Domain of unknown function (DUF5667)